MELMSIPGGGGGGGGGGGKIFIYLWVTQT